MMTVRNTLLSLTIACFLSLSTGVLGKEVPERDDIDPAYKWDLSDMYASTAAWEADRDRFIDALPGLEQYRGQLDTDGPTLLTAIESIQGVETIIANLYVYAGLRSYEDTRVSENAARYSEAQASMPNISKRCLTSRQSSSRSLKRRYRNLSPIRPHSPYTGTISMKRHACVPTPSLKPRKNCWPWPLIRWISLTAYSLPSTARTFNLVPWLIATATRSN